MTGASMQLASGEGRPRRGRSSRPWMGLVVLALVLTGCGQPKGVVFEPVDPPIRWPRPPDVPRIHYVGSLATSEDLKPARSFGQGLGEALFGKASLRSMLSPYAVCTDDGDRVFVCDSNGQVVHVFDLETRVYEQWRPDVEGDAFAQPVGIVFDAARGRLIVADSVAGTLFVFGQDGRYLGQFGGAELERPCGLAIDPGTRRLFVADSGTHQVVVLALDGELLTRLGGRGTELGAFNYPTNVVVDDAGRLYVSDSLNFRVQVFDTALSPVRQVGSRGDLPGYFSQPKGVALDSDGHLYVIDAHFEAVQIFDPRGPLLLTFGEEGHGPGQFWLPSGIHIDSRDRIWIADSYNRRIQVFDYRPEVQP